jgi:CubicO group peptidase (beta-lactamase class C family)
VDDLEDAVDRLAAQTGFSGVVRVDRGDEVVLEKAYGYAHRAHQIPNRVDTQFGIASGTKGFTALTVVSLIEDGVLERNTTARSLLDDDLPLVHDDVTVEQLLGHRSGIGDYMDEEVMQDITEYVLAVPVQELASTEQYIAVLDGYPTAFAPGTRFAYCNGGYVVLALLAERASGVPFADLVQQRVCRPAGLSDTEFLRSDELPARAALGYLSVDAASRTNVFHLPVRGSGDGGLYSTAADIAMLWRSFFAGRIVPQTWVDEMIRAHSERYGLGFWLEPSCSTVRLNGYDAGVSFDSVHDPARRLTHTVMSNTAEGAWPIARHLTDHLP